MVGKRIRIPRDRTLVLDICHFAPQIPRFPVEKQFDLAALADARNSTESGQRISWLTLFVRAMGIVSQDFPSLRQSYMRWPWPHYYEHDCANASVTVQREGNDGPLLGFGRFYQVDQRSLESINDQLKEYKYGPTKIAFREQLTFIKFPWPLRYIAWMAMLNLVGSRKAKKLGTFSVSTLASMGTTNRFHPTLLTTSLTYGPLDERGHCLVTLICDHRVMDGVLAAEILNSLEQTMQTVVLAELAGRIQYKQSVAA